MKISTMKNPKKKLASKHEYVYFYAKNKEQFEINKIREENVSDKLIKRFGKYANENGEILFKDVQNETSYLSRIIPKFVKENGRQPFGNDVIDILRGNYVRDVINIPACRTNELKSKFNIDFEYPKPVDLIKLLISLASQKDSIILDFFAGSGTTGQAVAELNKEDGGTRQFILVTNNDTSDKLPLGICTQVTLPRLQKTIGQENLKYYRIQTIPKDGEYTSNHIDQLVDNNKLLQTLQVQYNAFTLVEKTDQYSIFANYDNTFYLGVWNNDIEPNGKLFHQKMDSLCKDNIVLVCRYDSYPQQYYKFINRK